MSDVDVAIIGGGAAGLSAAIFAAQRARELGLTRRIVILDGATALGAKILVSGGGRCNVTHDQIGIGDFNGSKHIVRNILASFGVAATVAWFEGMGVQLKREEGGKLFPVTDSARTVLNALLQRCEELGVQVLSGHRVADIQADGDFTIIHGRGSMRAARVIMATGGRSLFKSGSDGQGWEMVRRLGHQVTDTYPALVPLVLDDGFFHTGLSGISGEVELSTFAGGKLVDRRTGSLLWTHFGISGPVVMDASRHWVMAQAAGMSPEMRCSLFAGKTVGQIEQMLIAGGRSQPRQSLDGMLMRHFPQRLTAALIRHAGLDAEHPITQLTREARRRLALVLTELRLPVVRDRGWNYAEVTAGGVPLGEIDYRTMGSRKTPGLHLVGEMLDCDGRIGGFNFQWAWATGSVAGRAAGGKGA